MGMTGRYVATALGDRLQGVGQLLMGMEQMRQRRERQAYEDEIAANERSRQQEIQALTLARQGIHAGTVPIVDTPDPMAPASPFNMGSAIAGLTGGNPGIGGPLDLTPARTIKAPMPGARQLTPNFYEVASETPEGREQARIGEAIAGLPAEIQGPARSVAAIDPQGLGTLVAGYYKPREPQKADTQIVETDGGFALVNKDTGESKPLSGLRPRPTGTAGGDANWQVVQTDKGLVQVNPKTGQTRQLGLSGPAPANQKALSMTESQAAGLFLRAEQGDKDLAHTEVPSVWEATAARAPIFGNNVASSRYQTWRQAAESFISAILRKESGAAISSDEFDRYSRIYIPLPGDAPAVLQMKATARKQAMHALKIAGGRAFGGVPVTDPAATANATDLDSQYGYSR